MKRCLVCALVVLLATACSASSAADASFTAKATAACLRDRPEHISGPLGTYPPQGFVIIVGKPALRKKGGSQLGVSFDAKDFRLGSNVEVEFLGTEVAARRLYASYYGYASRFDKAARLLQRRRNAVLSWGAPASDRFLRIIIGCLKS